MDRRDFLSTLVLLGGVALVSRAAAATRVAVIVHPKNPLTRLGPGEIEALFTTRMLDFPGGARAVPFNFPARHPLREAFDRGALHWDADEAARYWIDRRVRGGHPPPRQLPDVRTMIRVVGSLDSAVGYVRKEDVTDAVRIVAEISI